MARYVKAEQGLQHSVIYTADDGRYFRFFGGKWTWRNSNPGNVHPGEISRKHGQIGIAGKMAVFPNREIGHAALLDCLKTKHGNQSIDQLIANYAPPEENPNFLAYKKDLHVQTGIMNNTKIKNFTPEQFENLWKTIEKWEGWKEGTVEEVYKISCVRKDEKGVISMYCADNIGWITKSECLALVKQGKIEAEICTSKLGNTYLKATGRSSLQKNFADLVEKKSMKNKLVISLLLLSIYFPATLSFAANQVFHYRPEIVTLTGVIKVKIFPAPPKSECIGDKEEIYRYLVLDHPIDVVPQKTDSDTNNELQKNIKTVHIVKAEDEDVYRVQVRSNWSNKFMNRHVRITGKLYSRIARVVMLAAHFELASR